MSPSVISLIGILLGMVILVFLAFKGYNVIIVSVIAALVVAVFAGTDILPLITDSYMTKFADFAKNNFMIFLLSAVFGKLMGDSGAADTIAYSMLRVVNHVHSQRTKQLVGGLMITAIVAVLTYGGVILNTSSYMALIPATQKIAYAATKAGIVNMTKTTAGELAPLGIRVNCVVPGLIQTPIAAERIAANREKLCAQIALQRFGVPSDVSRVYTFLASDAAAFITGAAIEVSGGKLCVQDIGAPWGKQI